MKKLFNLAIAAAVLVACSAHAQTPVTPKIYRLTNSTTFTIATGGTNVAASGTVAINSQPFQIWRGRGFAFNTGYLGTNADIDGTMTYVFQFSTPITNGSTLTTNWETAPTKVVLPPPANARSYAWTNVPPNIIDNMTLGRLQSIINSGTNAIVVDATNTFISVIP